MTVTVSGLVSEPWARRGVAGILAETREAVEPVHRATISGLPQEIRHIAGYHIGWWDSGGRPTGGQGKAVRPALTLGCARAVLGPGTGAERAGRWAAAAAAAVAVEMVHDFSLLHDDVMDGDPVRRHRPAVWVEFGTSQALLVGDTLLAAAVDLVGAEPWVKVLTAAVVDLCLGQAADLRFETGTGIALEECLAMAAGKTGAVLGAACAMGALAAGAPAPDADHYRGFGLEVGLAFQHTDDLLGIWGDPAATGKPVGSDLASRKKSLPVVAALASGTTAGDRLADLYAQDGELDDDQLTRAASLVEAAGGREWARAEADRRIAVALDHLDAARPDPDAAADLRTLAAFMLRREH
ncbi:polyprenyl synthetase family protein [Actinocorallia lasiicapitis]